MSAILKELKLLDARKANGTLSTTEFEILKSALLDSVPEADEPAPTEVEEDVEVAMPSAEVPEDWDILASWLIAASLCGLATWAITSSFNMGSTVAIIVLAAFTIKLFNVLD